VLNQSFNRLSTIGDRENLCFSGRRLIPERCGTLFPQNVMSAPSLETPRDLSLVLLFPKSPAVPAHHFAHYNRSCYLLT